MLVPISVPESNMFYQRHTNLGLIKPKKRLNALFKVVHSCFNNTIVRYGLIIFVGG